MRICANASPRVSKLNKPEFVQDLKTQITAVCLILTTAALIVLGGCSASVDHEQVIGTWVIRKDSSEMKVVFSNDSLILSYKPENTRVAYKYEWREEAEKGHMLCYTQVKLDSEGLATKLIPSDVYIEGVDKDSLHIFIPRLKTQFGMKRK